VSTDSGQPPAVFGSTPSQTVGPFLSIGMSWDDGEWVVADGTPGAFWIRGRLIDGAGEGVPDGVVETWQADPEGRFDHPDDPRGAVARQGFRGYARSATQTDGSFAIHTVKPGPVPDGEGGSQAPHIDISVLARGLLDRVVTRCYFADEAAANAADPVLGSLPDDPSRATLVAEVAPDGYRLDIVLQGERETTFFAV
jgi:protocatechuate 3,4-dioxygenase alpha subunit